MAELMEARPEIVDKLVKDGKVSIYQPEQEGLIFPDLPTFANAAEQRERGGDRVHRGPLSLRLRFIGV